MRKWILIFVILAGIAAFLWHGRYGSTPAFRDNSGKIVQGSVAVMERVMLGGIEQSIVIRGRNKNAPILIWLHGGPGTDEIGMWRRYNAALEDHFLVVYWTQRGTGRSYHSDIPTASMTLPQFVADLDQLVGILQTRFDQQKLVLAGHSWGTNIGVVYAQAHPENVAALVSIGQIANSAEGERRSYAYTLAEAKRRRESKAIAELIKIGPPPHSIESLMIQRGYLSDFGGNFRKPASMMQLMWTSYKASEVTWYDGAKLTPGGDFSMETIWPQVAKFDWMGSATRFNVPVFIAAGRYDRNTDADLARAYFDKIEAPFKQFKSFEQSAHSPMFEEPDAFNRFMIADVLPVALQSRGTLAMHNSNAIKLAR